MQKNNMQENNLQQISCRITSEGDLLRKSACEDKQQSGYEAQHASGAERPGADFWAGGGLGGLDILERVPWIRHASHPRGAADGF